MTKKLKALKFKLTIAAPPGEVYRAFTQSSILREWLCDFAQAYEQVNGQLYLGWKSGYFASGVFKQIKPEKFVSFSWYGRGDPGLSQVRVRLKPAETGDSESQKEMTTVSLSHLLPGEDGDWKKSAKEFRKGWTTALENLKSVIESGKDRRITQRPLLGFSGLRELTQEDAGFPMSSGILVTGVIEGMGAHKAGLQPGDVLVKANGTLLSSLSDLRSVVQQHKAMDEIKIIYFRGADKRRTLLTLSSMPIPPIPGTQDGLIHLLEANHRSALKDLRTLLTGCTLSEAVFRPEPEQWNILEVLAHMTTGERAIHTWINGMVINQGTNDIPFHYANDLAMQAIIKAYPTPRLLFNEFQRHVKETLQMLQLLPVALTARKSTVWRLAMNLTFIPDHTRDHLIQIENLLKAARSGQPAGSPQAENIKNP